MANIADVSKATVSRWTTGKVTPHPKTQLVLSDLLDGNRAVELIQNDRTGEMHAVIERLESLTYR